MTHRKQTSKTHFAVWFASLMGLIAGSLTVPASSASAQASATNKPVKVLVLPLHGPATQAWIQAAEYATDFLAKKQAQVLVLEIASGGGDAVAVDQLIEHLRANLPEDAPVWVSVKAPGAFGPAAAIALSWPNACISPKAVIGNSVTGLPTQEAPEEQADATPPLTTQTIPSTHWPAGLLTAMLQTQASFYAWQDGDEIQTAIELPDGVESLLIEDGPETLLALNHTQALALGFHPSPTTYTDLAPEGQTWRLMGKVGQGMVAKAKRSQKMRDLQTRRSEENTARQATKDEKQKASLIEERRDLTSAYEEAVREAYEEDPQNSRYTVYPNGNFIAESQARWWANTKDAQEHWVIVEQVLQRLERVESTLETLGEERRLSTDMIASGIQKSREEWQRLEENLNSQRRPD